MESKTDSGAPAIEFELRRVKYLGVAKYIKVKSCGGIKYADFVDSGKFFRIVKSHFVVRTRMGSFEFMYNFPQREIEIFFHWFCKPLLRNDVVQRAYI